MSPAHNGGGSGNGQWSFIILSFGNFACEYKILERVGDVMELKVYLHINYRAGFVYEPCFYWGKTQGYFTS